MPKVFVTFIIFMVLLILVAIAVHYGFSFPDVNWVAVCVVIFMVWLVLRLNGIANALATIGQNQLTLADKLTKIENNTK